MFKNKMSRFYGSLCTFNSGAIILRAWDKRAIEEKNDLHLTYS